MPTYEYECTGCGRRFEKFEGINARPADRCPACGAAARRLISAGGGIIMKAASRQPRCGQGRPCCGAESACGTPHCME